MNSNIDELDILKRNAIEAANRKALNEWQLRKVLDQLYDGTPDTMIWLAQIRAFYSKKKNLYREHAVYMFLVRNKLTGPALVNFFNEQGGFLSGMNWLINRMDGRKYTLENIKIDEAL